MKKQRLAESNFDDSLRAINQTHILRRRAKVRASRHEIQRRVDVPFVRILCASIRKNQGRPSHNAVGIRRRIEKTGPGKIAVKSRCQLIKIGLGSLGKKTRSSEGLQHPDFLLLLSVWMEGMSRRVREKGNLVGIGVESGNFHSPEVGIREEKIVPEDDGAKSLDRSCELLVRIKGCGEPLNFGRKFGVDRFSPFPPGLQFSREGANRRRGLIRFAEGNVEPHDFRAAVMQNIQRLGEICTGEGPAAQDFLRALVYVNDDDPGIRMGKTPRAVTKACVQRGKLKPLDKFENRSGPLADKGENVQKEGEDGDGEAQEKRNTMAPPGLE